MRSEIAYLLYAFFAVVECFVMALFFRRFIGKKFNRVWAYTLVYGIYFILNFSLSAFELTINVKSLLTLVFSIGVAVFLYAGKIWQRLIAAILLVTYISISEIFVMTLLSWMRTYHFPVQPPDNAMYFIGAGLTSMICLLIVGIISRRQQTLFMQLPINQIVFVLIMIVLCGLIAYIDLIFGVYSTQTATLLHVISKVVLCIMAVMLYFVFENFQRHAAERTHDAMIHVQMEQMRKQFKMIEDYQVEERIKRHDFENHLHLIQQLMDSGNLTELSDYVTGLAREAEIRTIENVTGILSIDAIITMKRAEAERQNTRFIILATKLTRVHIDPIHINIVLSNALDNALEACAALPENADRFVELGLKTSGDFLYVRITNPYVQDSTNYKNLSQANINNTEEHGLGLGSIRKTILRYDGILSYEPVDKEVIVRFRMKNVPLSEIEMKTSNAFGS
jgi:signal transduction histidine kinase